MWKGATRWEKVVAQLNLREKDAAIPKGITERNQLGMRGRHLFQATPKKTLGHIVRLKWDEHTLNTKGAKREAFYDSCIKNFKEYYAYPKIYDPEDGDRVVRAYLKRNFKSYLNVERGRLMHDVNEILKRGYPESVINIRLMRPYYFSQRAWNAICDHWETPEFANKSEKGHNSRMNVEFTPRTGAKPFDQRREEIDAQREAKGEMPITDEEFLSVAYDPTDPTVKDLQEKMKNVRSFMPELTLETPSDEPPSPSTLKEIQRKKDIFVMMQARPPTRGKLNLYPQQTVGELVGAMEATQWAKQMAWLFAKINQFLLRFYDISTGKDFSKFFLVIGLLWETQSEKAVEVHKSVEVDGAVNHEDEDMDAHNYPLF
ncbi:hypothetical protein POM88_033579 [Heracleum sosnowskyi]|uniref:Uncharacterized protein n=1 Tax=Heracleum sosnowskyi TaxID=360622 RepID=A0AAD8ML56_9APIA|nr:hypothetical protein POM88_033579 [Heracleum sosnowskyi]